MSFISANRFKDTPEIQLYQSVGKRDEQQDSYLVCRMDSGVLIAVADGHGGFKTSEKAVTHLPGLLHEQLEVAWKGTPNARYFGVSDQKMRQAVRLTLNRLIDLCRDDVSGSTLTLAYLEQGTRRTDQGYLPQVRATVAQLGDSVFALSVKPGHLCVMPMHSAKDAKKDVAAIKARYRERYGRECKWSAGYIYSHCNGVDALALTRALGDMAYTLVRKPEVKTYTIAPDQAVLLLASDGILTDCSRPRNLIRGYIDQLHQGRSAKALGESISYQHDNTTIMAVRL
jgi:serine/threonine protein phosphatase PrpC